VRDIGRKKPNKGVRSDYKILRSKRLIEEIKQISPELTRLETLQTQLRDELELMATITDSLTTHFVKLQISTKCRKDEMSKQD